MMRAILFALTGVFLAGAAFAAEAEGKVTAVDMEKLTITLEDGKSYRLPGEMDMSVISEGITVVLAYDKVGDVNQITDMIIDE